MLQLWAKGKAGKVFSDMARGSGIEVGGWQRKFVSYEDSLVASVFGTASYLPFRAFMAQLLRHSEVKKGNTFPTDTIIEPTDILLWPTEKYFEGDVNNAFSSSRHQRRGKGRELDCLWQFGSIFLIIEAKRPGESFDVQQPRNYVKLIKRYAKAKGYSDSEFWVLLVGNGISAQWSLEEVDTSNIPNLLYLEWANLVRIIRESIGKMPLHVRLALEGITNILDMLVLKSFEGFTWPPPGLTEFLADNLEDLDWFRPRFYPLLPETSVSVSPKLPFYWFVQEEG